MKSQLCSTYRLTKTTRQMGCQIQSSNPQIIRRISKRRSTDLPSFSAIQFQPKLRTKIVTLSSSSYQQQDPISTTTTVTQPDGVSSVDFKTLGACKLGISSYPDFDYNAQGGKGTGTATNITGKEFNGETTVEFDVKTLYIPPLTTSTTRFLGLPLPPFLKIDIVLQLFKGSINPESGKVDLQFKAKFWFSIGSIYKAPPLVVETVLTSEESKGKLRNGRGERMDTEGRCRLVGVATVEPINDFLMDSFLGLPTECLADLNAIISFPST